MNATSSRPRGRGLRARPGPDLAALRALLAAAGLLALHAALGGCARVLQKDREYLSDPILQLQPDPQGGGLEAHNLPRREGSAGGGAGSGGGCGC